MADEANIQTAPIDEEALTPLDVREMQAAWVFDVDGEPVGKIADVLVHAPDDKPEWIVVSYGAFLHNDMLVPVLNLKPHEHGYVTPYTKKQIHEAPDVNGDDMTEKEEQLLMAYWCADRPDMPSPRACKYLHH